MAKLRIGIIGAGGRGINSFAAQFVRDFPDTTQVVAFADTNPVRARAGMEHLGIEVDVHEDAEELVKRKDINAVVVTTPDCFHEEHAVMALRNKKHCFVDKPLATTVQGCVNVVEAAKAARRVLYMGFNLRHNIVIKNLRRMAREGRFGEIFSMRAVEYYNGGRTYHSRWNRLKKYSGGLWVHKGSHDFDVINYIMGKVRPARVSCFASVSFFTPDRLPFTKRKGVEPGPTCDVCPYLDQCPDAYPVADVSEARKRMFSQEAAAVDGYHKNLCMYLSDKDTHDQGIAIIEYENGATAMHSECFATPMGNRIYAIDGTAGHCDADLRSRSIRFYPRWTNDCSTYEMGEQRGGHGGSDPVMLRNFLDCIHRRARPIANAVDGAWSVAIGRAAEISREQVRVVEISELMDTESKLLR